MNAVVFDGELRFIKDYPVPEPSGNEALIRVLMAGICATDLEIIKGYKGYKGILGHEFVGVVEKMHGHDTSLIGKRVVGEINIGCGSCDYCIQGLGNHCLNRKVLGIQDKDGALAGHVTLPLKNLHRVPDSLPDEEAVFTEPLAAAFEILEQISIRPDHRILVLGDGKLGLLIALVLNLKQSGVTIAGRHEHKLKIVREKNIKTVVIGNLKPERHYDIVVEATGSPQGFATAMNMVKPRGTIVLKSAIAGKSEMNLAPVVVNEITVIGSRCGLFKAALEALSKGSIVVHPFISGILPFSRAQEAFKRAASHDSLKIIIDFRYPSGFAE